jgi:hypothetical protein
MSLPFWLSIGLLSLCQGAVVALPGRIGAGWLRGRGRWWAAVPPLSVIAFVFVARAAEHASAQGLTYLALVAVPPLAAVALGRLGRGGRPAAAALVVPLFALAWVGRSSLTGQIAALALTALSCVSLGALIAALTPASWLAAGIVAMAIADTALVVSDLLQRPNDALNAAHPAAHLPRLQSAALGSAVMGYGDLFVAGVLGGLLAARYGRGEQLRGAAATAALAICMDLLFFAVSELPATVPVALALLLSAALRVRRSARARSQPTSRPARAAPHPARARAVR